MCLIGLYAAREAYKLQRPPWKPDAPIQQLPNVSVSLALVAALEKDFPLNSKGFVLPAEAAGVTPLNPDGDMHGVMADGNCDDPETPNVDTITCYESKDQMFPFPKDLEAEELGLAQPLPQGLVVSGAAHLHTLLFFTCPTLFLWL